MHLLDAIDTTAYFIYGLKQTINIYLVINDLIKNNKRNHIIKCKVRSSKKNICKYGIFLGMKLGNRREQFFFLDQCWDEVSLI